MFDTSVALEYYICNATEHSIFIFHTAVHRNKKTINHYIDIYNTSGKLQ